MAQARYGLVGNHCKTCGRVFFPPALRCEQCGSEKLDKKQLSGDGVIETFTTIKTPPAGFEVKSSYCVGIIRLHEGCTISGQIVSSPEKIAIGKKVHAVFRKLSEDGKDGIINYGFKFAVDSI